MFTWTCGWAPGSMPGGSRSAILSGSVRYTSLSNGQPAISPGVMLGVMVVTIAPGPGPRNRRRRRERPRDQGRVARVDRRVRHATLDRLLPRRLRLGAALRRAHGGRGVR